MAMNIVVIAPHKSDELTSAVSSLKTAGYAVKLFYIGADDTPDDETSVKKADDSADKKPADGETPTDGEKPADVKKDDTTSELDALAGDDGKKDTAIEEGICYVNNVKTRMIIVEGSHIALRVPSITSSTKIGDRNKVTIQLSESVSMSSWMTGANNIDMFVQIARNGIKVLETVSVVQRKVSVPTLIVGNKSQLFTSLF